MHAVQPQFAHNEFRKVNSEGSLSSYLTIADFSKSYYSSATSDVSLLMRCRICFDSDLKEKLIAPCLCTGSIGLLHKQCLEKWLNLSRSRVCEICGYRFTVIKQYPTFKNWLWLGGTGDHLSRRKHLWTDCICVTLMLPLLTLCAWLTISSGKEEAGDIKKFPWQSLSLGILFSLLLVVFSIWLMFSLRYHMLSWKIWRHAHSFVVLSDKDLIKKPVKRMYKRRKIKQLENSAVTSNKCNQAYHETSKQETENDKQLATNTLINLPNPPDSLLISENQENEECVNSKHEIHIKTQTYDKNHLIEPYKNEFMTNIEIVNESHHEE